MIPPWIITQNSVMSDTDHNSTGANDGDEAGTLEHIKEESHAADGDCNEPADAVDDGRHTPGRSTTPPYNNDSQLSDGKADCQMKDAISRDTATTAQEFSPKKTDVEAMA